MKKIKYNQSQLTLPLIQRGASFKTIGIFNYSLENRVSIFWILLTIFTLSFVAYIYGINALSRSVALRQSLERESMMLASDLATLEFEYISLKNKITIDLAKERGFDEVSKPLYIAKAKTVPTLSLNTGDLRTQ